jgi:hypothetical protein
MRFAMGGRNLRSRLLLLMIRCLKRSSVEEVNGLCYHAAIAA